MARFALLPPPRRPARALKALHGRGRCPQTPRGGLALPPWRLNARHGAPHHLPTRKKVGRRASGWVLTRPKDAQRPPEAFAQELARQYERSE